MMYMSNAVRQGLPPLPSSSPQASSIYAKKVIVEETTGDGSDGMQPRSPQSKAEIIHFEPDTLSRTSEKSFEYTHLSSDDEKENHEDQQITVSDLFAKARQLLCPTKSYRTITYLYAERKLVVFFMVHLVSTLIIWTHFALKKLDSQLEKVPEGANRYWWKILAPPLEFGSMHAILFQMALIPLTMARFSISTLCESMVDKILPLNRAVRMHIHLGYTMILVLIWAVIFFFAFFGLL